ncbi:MAG: helix-turn-helix domain-containing protein [Lachnospiraceae bacterium]|nr:helix-turn-helix domain-containing protein [Lachnospiraceae bacterium]
MAYNFKNGGLSMVQGLGERLRQKRSCMKISQKEAAEAIGVSYSIISNYEKNERTPSVESLMALANLYQCSVDYLLGIEKSSNASIDASMLDEEQRARLQYFLSSINK